MSDYTPAQQLADQRAIDAALRPVVDAMLADLGLTRDQALAMLRAGQPCPEPLEVRRERKPAA